MTGDDARHEGRALGVPDAPSGPVGLCPSPFCANAGRECPLSCGAGLFDLVPTPVFAYALDGLEILAANEAAVTAYGWSREELLAMKVTDLRPPEDVPELLAVLSREGTARRVLAQARHRRKDGAAFPVEVTSRPIAILGRPARLAVVQDVSARTRAEQHAQEQEQRARILAQQLPAIVWAVDRDLVITASLGAGLPALGLAQGQLCNVPLSTALGPGGEVYLDHHRRALTGDPVSYETSFAGRAYQVHIEPRRDADGRVAGAVGMALDVTDQRRVREQARQAESRLRVFAGQIPAVLWSTDRGLRFTWSDGAGLGALGLGALGLGPNQVVGLTLEEYFQPAGPGYPPFEAHEAALRGETVAFETEFRGRTFHCHVEPLLDAHGAIAGTIGAALDITERKRAEEQVVHQAEYDALTDLPNRTLFDRRLRAALERAGESGDPLAVVFLDLDHFKRVNDALGHLVGDELLRGAAHRLREAVRLGDTVARIGGDEFLLLLPGLKGREDAIHVSEKILTLSKRPYYVQGRELFATASLGIAVFPQDGTDAETLVKNADAAMYRAKEQGRCGYQLYHPEDSARALERVGLEAGLRRAAAGEPGLLLHFQPQVRLVSGEVVGVEALLRWEHESRGLLLPVDFLGLAEELGLVLALGDLVLEAAAWAARRWAERCGGTAPRVAVNLHSFDLRDRRLVDRIEKVLETTGCTPSLLELEITEGAAMENVEVSIRTLRKLREMGFALAIDDFGTGHSSLSYLKLLPVDRVKIDRSFVRDIAHDARDRAIVSSIISLGHALGLAVVAEGVETHEQEERLLEAGCDEAQGYLMGRPAAAEATDGLLARPPGWWRPSGARERS